jgi:hypothetical protein
MADMVKAMPEKAAGLQFKPELPPVLQPSLPGFHPAPPRSGP